MAKKSPKKRTSKYDQKLQVDASFMEIIQAVVKDAEKNTLAKKMSI